MKMAYLFKAIIFKSKIFFEKKRGIDLSTIVEATELGLDPNRVFHSSPSGNKYLYNVLNSLGIGSKSRILDVAREVP